MAIQSGNIWNYLPLVSGFAGLAFALMFFFRVRSLPDGNPEMNRIAGYIREGAMAFLRREYQMLAGYVVGVFALIAALLGFKARTLRRKGRSGC